MNTSVNAAPWDASLFGLPQNPPLPFYPRNQSPPAGLLRDVEALLWGRCPQEENPCVRLCVCLLLGLTVFK